MALLKSPNGLGATAVSAYAEKCQELSFLRFSAVGPTTLGKQADEQNLWVCKDEVKQNVKRAETSRVLYETGAPVFAPSRFMVSERFFIGETV